MIIRHLIHHKRQIHPHRLAIRPCTASALGQRNVVVEHTHRHGIRRKLGLDTRRVNLRAYLLSLGGDGLREASGMAVLNANYLKTLLQPYAPVSEAYLPQI